MSLNFIVIAILILSFSCESKESSIGIGRNVIDNDTSVPFDQLKPSELSFDQCELLYSKRNFSLNETSRSIMLLSITGSGNTWTRSLIEYSTGQIALIT